MKKHSILIVEDNDAAVFGYEEVLSESNYLISSASTLASAHEKMNVLTVDAILLDLNLPDGNSLSWIPTLKQRYPNIGIIVITADTDVTKAVTAMRNGADNYLTKPVNFQELQISLQKCLEFRKLRKRMAAQNRISPKVEPFFGDSTIVQTMLDYADLVSASESIVLLQGETGTGKGIFAKRIHNHSDRNKQPFVPLNCSMLKGGLLKSELFGHTKGAFTSAVKDRQGFIEAADGGTLFLDEIGDMDLDVQAQLLKTIEEKTFRRVGENKLRSSDFRLICASHRDLEQLATEGKFRQDLYYRICVFPICIPPLRERIEDIEGLSHTILRSFSYPHIPLQKEVFDLLKHYDYPGNIRELRNMLERAIILSHQEVLEKHHFPGIGPPKKSLEVPIKMPNDNFPNLNDFEKEYIQYILNHCSWDKNKAAEILGISRSSIYRKIPELSETPS